MKKILALVMALLVVMVCGVATAEQAAPKIGIAIYQFADNFMTLYRTELVRYLTEDCGIPAENITVMDGKNDQAEQTNQIDGFIADNVDVMILNLVQSTSAANIWCDPYSWTSRTRHSIFTGLSAIIGADTCSAVSRVRWHSANLSTSLPERTPQ